MAILPRRRLRYCCFCADSMREYSVVRLIPSIFAA
jgi:hypothetical protein